MNYESGFARDDAVEIVYDEEAAAKARRRRWIIIGAVAAAIILVAAYVLTRGGGGAPAAAEGAKQVPTVSVVVPGRQLVEREVSATGTLAARREMPVGVAGEGGMVTRVLVEPGQWVGAGQVLATVDRQVQVQQNASLAAQINVARADAALAQNELDRAAALVARGFVSKADVDRKTAARDAAAARVRVAQAQLGESRARTGRLDIRAPAAGLILTRQVEPGQVVGAGSGVLFRMARGGEMELLARLSEADLAVTPVGARATVTPVGANQNFTGQVWQVSPVIDPENRQGTARVALAYNQALRPGGFAGAKIVTGAQEAPVLPESAVQSDEKGNFVYMIDRANKVVRRPVTTGPVTAEGLAIVAGLAGNERIVLRAGGFLSPGETVKPELKK